MTLQKKLPKKSSYCRVFRPTYRVMKKNYRVFFDRPAGQWIYFIFPVFLDAIFFIWCTDNLLLWRIMVQAYKNIYYIILGYDNKILGQGFLIIVIIILHVWGRWNYGFHQNNFSGIFRGNLDGDIGNDSAKMDNRELFGTFSEIFHVLRHFWFWETAKRKIILAINHAQQIAK